MMTDKELLILSKSRKYGNFCLAGYDLREQEWIRLTSTDARVHFSVLHRDIVLDNTGAELEVMDIVRVRVTKAKPAKANPHQVENWQYDPHHRWLKIDTARLDDIPASAFYNASKLFFNDRHCLSCSELKTVSSANLGSLALIQPSFVEFYLKEYEGNRKIYANIKWNNAVYRKLGLTDPHLEQALVEKSTAQKCTTFFVPDIRYLLLSLSGQFEQTGMYYKLVASILPTTATKVHPKYGLLYK